MAAGRGTRVTRRSQATPGPTVRSPLDKAPRGAEPRRGPPAPATRLRWLRAVLEQMPSAVLIAESQSGTIVFWNEQAARHWPNFLPVPDGLSAIRRCQLIRSDGRPYVPEDWPLARALHTGASTATEEIEFVGDDRTRTVMDVRCTPVRDDQGQISAVIAILQDVTDRTRAERRWRPPGPDMRTCIRMRQTCLLRSRSTLNALCSATKHS